MVNISTTCTNTYYPLYPRYLYVPYHSQNRVFSTHSINRFDFVTENDLEVTGRLRCDAVLFGECFPKFRKLSATLSSRTRSSKLLDYLKLEDEGTTSFRNVGTTVTPHRTTRRHNPEDLCPLAPPLREVQIFRDAMNLTYDRIQCPSNIAQCYCTSALMYWPC